MDEKGRIDRPPREFRAEIFTRFREALEPRLGRLGGGTLFQFPPYYQRPLARLPRVGGEQMGDDDARRVPPRELVRGGRPRRGRSSRSTGCRSWWWTRQSRGEERPANAARRHRPDGLRPVPRSQREDLELPRRERRRAVRLPLLRRRAARVSRPLRELAGQAQNACAFFNNNNRSPGDGGYGGMSPRCRERADAQNCLQETPQQLVERFRRSTFVKRAASSSTSRRPFCVDDSISWASSCGRNVLAADDHPERALVVADELGRVAPVSQRLCRADQFFHSARVRRRGRAAPTRRCPARAASRSLRCGRARGRRRRRRPARRPGTARATAHQRASARAPRSRPSTSRPPRSRRRTRPRLLGPPSIEALELVEVRTSTSCPSRVSCGAHISGPSGKAWRRTTFTRVPPRPRRAAPRPVERQLGACDAERRRRRRGGPRLEEAHPATRPYAHRPDPTWSAVSQRHIVGARGDRVSGSDVAETGTDTYSSISRPRSIAIRWTMRLLDAERDLRARRRSGAPAQRAACPGLAQRPRRRRRSSRSARRDDRLPGGQHSAVRAARRA